MDKKKLGLLLLTIFGILLATLLFAQGEVKPQNYSSLVSLQGTDCQLVEADTPLPPSCNPQPPPPVEPPRRDCPRSDDTREDKNKRTIKCTNSLGQYACCNEETEYCGTLPPSCDKEIDKTIDGVHYCCDAGYNNCTTPQPEKQCLTRNPSTDCTDDGGVCTSQSACRFDRENLKERDSPPISQECNDNNKETCCIQKPCQIGEERCGEIKCEMYDENDKKCKEGQQDCREGCKGGTCYDPLKKTCDEETGKIDPKCENQQMCLRLPVEGEDPRNPTKWCCPFEEDGIVQSCNDEYGKCLNKSLRHLDYETAEEICSSVSKCKADFVNTFYKDSRLACKVLPNASDEQNFNSEGLLSQIPQECTCENSALVIVAKNVIEPEADVDYYLSAVAHCNSIASKNGACTFLAVVANESEVKTLANSLNKKFAM